MYKTGSKFNIKTSAGEFAEIIGVYPGGQQKPKTEYKIIYAGAVFVIEEAFLKLIFNEIEIADPILAVFKDLNKEETVSDLSGPVEDISTEEKEDADAGEELKSRDMDESSDAIDSEKQKSIDEKSGGARRGRPRQS